jgi:hypothetical protein
VPVPLEGHEVADAQRLGDGQDHAGDRVGQHLTRGEADDGGRDGAGGQHRGGEAIEARELRDGQRQADHDDRGLHDTAQEAQPRVDDRTEVGAAERLGEPVRAPAHRAMDDRYQHEGDQEGQTRGDVTLRSGLGCDDDGRHGA